MVVKKTVAKKSTKKAPAKQANVSKVVEKKKPTVIVETKKTDRCECKNDCTCGCSCCCSWIKILVLLLIVANLVVSFLCLCNRNSGRSAWNLEALKVWWQENLEKLRNGLYWSEAYKSAQKESIEAYIQSLWIE